jgi:hypothetical protein
VDAPGLIAIPTDINPAKHSHVLGGFFISMPRNHLPAFHKDRTVDDRDSREGGSCGEKRQAV